jgi:hypothetical protein
VVLHLVPDPGCPVRDRVGGVGMSIREMAKQAASGEWWSCREDVHANLLSFSGQMACDWFGDDYSFSRSDLESDNWHRAEAFNEA